MDEFGVLVESIGFRAHGKSAPMTDLKAKPKSRFPPVNAPTFNDSSSLPIDELDGIFRSSVNVGKTNHSQKFFGGDDIFGGPVSSSHHYGGFDLESVFSSSTSTNRMSNGGNFSSTSSVGSNAYDDLLGSVGSKSKQSDSVDDLFGGFGGNGKQEKRGAGLDDLISGFRRSSPSKTNVYSNVSGHSSNSSSTTTDDPFLVFESYAPQSDASWPFDRPSEKVTGKGSVQSSFDDLDDFVMGGARSGSKVEGLQTAFNKPGPGTASNGFGNTNYVDEIFGGGSTHAHQNNAARSSSMAKSSSLNDFFYEEKKKTEVKRTPSQPSFNTKKATHVDHDFTSLFGDVTTSSEIFQEIEGEPADRRTARMKRHMMRNARIAEALAEKTQRDLQHQRDQEEKARHAETLDNEIRCWAAGKEGNLRALLSSLQQILGPESGWRPVSLTDMITSDSVKKVYKKANLYVHPDKVQQRGANIRQQYIAEKVFDLLKEAWTKFSADELR